MVPYRCRLLLQQVPHTSLPHKDNSKRWLRYAGVMQCNCSRAQNCRAAFLQELQQELAQVRQGAATSAARQEDAQAELQAQVDSLQSQLQHAEALAE